MTDQALQRNTRAARGFTVTIVYTEPEFQRRNPDTPPSYVADFDCPGALDARQAVWTALSSWDWYAVNSSVGWQRIIQSIEVRRISGH